MNVKSYLKGIGVGMIVASLILIIAGNMNKVSDEDVIARAKELGYVQSTSVSQEEVDNTSSNTEQKKIEDSDKVESTENNDANTDNAKADDKATDVNTNNENAEDKVYDANADSSTTETANTTNDTTVSDDSDKTADNNATSSETVKVEIKSGMSSESAALAVKNAGLIESDTEFNKYLCSEGYDKRLRVGSFEIPKDADFETIAKSLCGIK